MVVLYIEDPQGSVKKPEFQDDVITIGRAKDNSIVLPERNISRHHLKIYWDGSQWMVEDAGSRYGTEYREQPLEAPARLVPNAYIKIGDYRIKLISATTGTDDNKAVDGMFAPETEDQKKTAEYTAASPEQDVEDLDGLDGDDVLTEANEKGSKKGVLFIIIGLLVLVGGYFIFSGKKAPVKGAQKNEVSRKTPENTPKKPEKIAVKPKEAPKPAKAPEQPEAVEKDAGTKVAAVRDAGTNKPAPAVEPAKKEVAAKETAKKPEPEKAPEPVVVKKAPPRPVVKKQKKVARAQRPRRPVKRVAKPVVKHEARPDNTEDVDALLRAARHTAGSGKMTKYRQCLQKYGSRCCKAHKYMAMYYQGNADIKNSIDQWRKYKACASSTREKNSAERMITQLQGL